MVQFKVGKKHRRLVLGAVSALDAGKARAAAKDALAAIRLGQDPVNDRIDSRIRAGETTQALCCHASWRISAASSSRARTRNPSATSPCSVGRSTPVLLDRCDRRAISIRLAELAESSGPAAANRCRASLSAYFSWLAREGIVDANPVSFTNKAVEVGAGHRFLSDDELAGIWRALGEDQYSSICKLLLLLGMRRDEVGSLRWSEVDLDRSLITLPPSRTKNRRVFEVPLSAAAIAILRAQPKRLLPDGTPRDFVFGHANRGYQDWSGSKSDLDAKLGDGVAPWVLHDFRRTLSTVMHERFATPPHVVEALLSHVSGHQGGIAGVYNKANYLDERRRVLERWADFIAGLVGERPAGKVVKLR